MGQEVNLNIYNLRGQRIKSLLQERLAPGTYTIKWNGSDDAGKAVASGIYVSCLQVGDLATARKLMVVK